MTLVPPNLTPAELVALFTESQSRYSAYSALVALGASALPAIREGLRHPEWQVRRWSAICLDRISDADAMEDLVPLLEDPKSQVRLWVVHSLACDHCKDEVECPVDVVPLLIKRALEDQSTRVRRMATIMLSTEHLDARALPVLETIEKSATDRKLLLHARQGIERYRAAGLA